MKYLTMSQFGRWGRFANELFQYAFLKSYAERYACELQLPPWVGNQLFGLHDPPVSVRLEQWKEQEDHLDAPPTPVGDEVVGKDFRGYAQYHTSYYKPIRDQMRKWFTPVPSIRDRLGPVVQRLQGTIEQDRTVIGLHLRRGDYGQLIFYITPVEWYLKWLEEHWSQFHNPLLFIATETPSLVRHFAKYDPVTAESLGVELRSVELANYPYLAADRQLRQPWQLDFYPDFYLLSRCDILVTPSSTFSMMAALLNPGLAEFWRSDLSAQSFVQLNPWDCYPIQHYYVDDYMIPGTYLDTNPPYWDRRIQRGNVYVPEVIVKPEDLWENQ